MWPTKTEKLQITAPSSSPRPPSLKKKEKTKRITSYETDGWISGGVQESFLTSSSVGAGKRWIRSRSGGSIVRLLASVRYRIKIDGLTSWLCDLLFNLLSFGFLVKQGFMIVP